MSAPTDPTGAIRVHVERTEDPSVLRWVTHDVTFVASASVDDPLGAMIVAGDIDDVRTLDGDVFIECRAGWTPQKTAAVHRALLTELEGACEAVPTIDAVQRVIDAAVGALASEHGGRIEVVDVDIDSGVVEVSLHGACHGCAGAESTLTDGAARAVHQRFGQLATVVPITSARSPLVRFLDRRSRPR